MQKHILYFLSLALALGIAGCGGNSSTTTINPGVTVAVAPVISAQPEQVLTTAGSTATYTVTATGSAPLQYQWYKNGAAISGATNAALTTPSLTAADNGANYFVKVTNSAGSVNSTSASLQIGQIMSLTELSDFTTPSLPSFLESVVVSTIELNDVRNGFVTYPLCRNPQYDGTNEPFSGDIIISLNGSEPLGGQALFAAQTNYKKVNIIDIDFDACNTLQGIELTGKTSTTYEIIKLSSNEFTTKIIMTTSGLKITNGYKRKLDFSGTIIINETRTLSNIGVLTSKKTLEIVNNSTIQSVTNQFNASITQSLWTEDTIFTLVPGTPIHKVTAMGGEIYQFADYSSPAKHDSVSSFDFTVGVDLYTTTFTINRELVKLFYAVKKYGFISQLIKNKILVVKTAEDPTLYIGIAASSYPVF